MLRTDFDAIRRRGAVPVSIEMTKMGKALLVSELNMHAFLITVSLDVKIGRIYGVDLRIVDALPDDVPYHIVTSDAR